MAEACRMHLGHCHQPLMANEKPTFRSRARSQQIAIDYYISLNFTSYRHYNQSTFISVQISFSKRSYRIGSRCQNEARQVDA